MLFTITACLFVYVLHVGKSVILVVLKLEEPIHRNVKKLRKNKNICSVTEIIDKIKVAQITDILLENCYVDSSNM